MSPASVKMTCAVALCLVLACCVQDSSSQGWDFGDNFWMPYLRSYWQSSTTTTYSICGGVRYDTVRTVCCSGRVLPRVDGCGCCGRTTYTITTRMCCSGTVTYRREGYNSCCGGRGYNAVIFRCCRGTVVSRYSSCY